MKKILLIPACMLAAACAFGQTTGGETVKQAPTIEQLKTDSPKEYQAVLDYAKNHGSSIVDLPSGKEAKLNGTVTMSQAQLVDPLKMGFTIPSANQYYKIEGTSKMLVVKSLFMLQQEMKSKH